MSNKTIPIKTNEQIVKERLVAEGYSGLYVPGECGCHLDDFAICGSLEEDEDGYINGCEPGHVIRDPSGKTSDFIVCGMKETMTQEEFDEHMRRYG